MLQHARAWVADEDPKALVDHLLSREQVDKAAPVMSGIAVAGAGGLRPWRERRTRRTISMNQNYEPDPAMSRFF